MLTDTQVERWARQIVLSEVGGHGQARLLASRVALAGDPQLRRAVADLLARAGVGRCDETGDAEATLRVELPEAVLVARLDGAAASLVGRRSGAPCSEPSPSPAPDSLGGLHACARHALAALVATETVLRLLDPARPLRRQTLDLASGTVGCEALTTEAA
jgi:hypothetical protein